MTRHHKKNCLFIAFYLGLFFATSQGQTPTQQNIVDRSLIKAADDLTKELTDRLNSTFFNLKGAITDADGTPLDEVEMEIKYSRPTLPFMDKTESKTELKTINSTFNVIIAGYSDISLLFYKEGYYVETLNLTNDFLQKDKKKEAFSISKDLHIKMIKRGTAAPLIGTMGVIKYDFKNSSKVICDLSMLNQKDQKVLIKRIDFSGQQGGKYIDLDFRRNGNGDILYEKATSTYKIQYPLHYLLRFHSDEKDDGLILINDLNPELTLEDFERKFNTAPEKGYKKEIVIDLGERKSDGNFSFVQLYVYIKCGNYYGKAVLRPINVSTSRTSIDFIGTKIEIYMNKKPGERNLTI